LLLIMFEVLLTFLVFLNWNCFSIASVSSGNVTSLGFYIIIVEHFSILCRCFFLLVLVVLAVSWWVRLFLTSCIHMLMWLFSFLL
jgi:hypothetical protein